MSEDNLETGTSEASDVELLSDDTVDDETSETEESPAAENIDDENPKEDEEEELSEQASEEEDEETEEDIKKAEEITRPSWKNIKENYPELAKDKDFREMFHREKAFSDLFPTVEDAREASERANVLDYFDNVLVSGDVPTFIGALSEPVLNNLANNILPTLQESNTKLFYQAVHPVLVQLLNSVDKRATQTGDENLKRSALHIAKFLFGEAAIPKMTSRVNPEVEEEKNRLREREQELANKEKTEFLGSSDRSIGKQLRKIISDGLDPKNELSEWALNKIVEDTINDTRSTLLQDEQFSSKMKHLFNLAAKAGYPSDYKPRLISAYLGRAKQVALTLRAKHKSAAMSKRTAQSKTKVRIEAQGSKKGTTTQTSTEKGAKKSDMDIIMEGA